jgi:hypothetical protein
MSVPRIWAWAHLTFSFKLSNDPNFCEKVQDMSGFISTRQTRRWYCRSTKKARSRHSIAPSRDCR